MVVFTLLLNRVHDFANLCLFWTEEHGSERVKRQKKTPGTSHAGPYVFIYIYFFISLFIYFLFVFFIYLFTTCNRCRLNCLLYKKQVNDHLVC